jgi:peptidoglycan/xylan/chitin deacetylase (PgdA/CDA1 family)
MPSMLNNITHALAHSGAVASILSWKQSNPVILMYHGVTDQKPDPARLQSDTYLHIQRSVFEAHLKIIQRYRRTISIDEMVLGLVAGDNLRNTVSITFDDGYENNYRVAAPLLTQYGLPATFYVATGMIGAKKYIWTDEVEMLFDRTNISQIKPIFFDEVLSLDSRELKLSALRKVKAAFKRMATSERLMAIVELAKLLAVKLNEPDLPDYRFMDWDQVRQLSHAGFDIGAHSINHPILSNEPLDVARMEILGSQEQVVHQLGRCSKVFCYPNGKEVDYSSGVIDICRQNFIGALSTSRGYARADELFQLRRIGAYAGAMSPYIEWTLLRER